MARMILAFAALCMSLAFSAGMARAEGERLALIIGNEAYENAPRLTTPVADAQGMARSLRDLGFDVTVLTDAGTDVFGAVLEAFAKKTEGAETVLFYYSGHAFQMRGVNRLVPVGARLEDPAALEGETLALDMIAARLKPAKGQLLLFLDACRSNPLAGVEPGGPGLAQYDGGAGTFVAFATAPGQVAWDVGADGVNSPFTGAVLRQLRQPGVSLSDMMIAVRNDVAEATGGKQTPWEQSSLRSQFFFLPAAPPAVAAVPAPADVPPASTLPAFDTVRDDTVLEGTVIAMAEPVTSRLTALPAATRSLSTLGSEGVPRIAGVEGLPPGLVLPPGVTLPENMAEAVQTELKRVGCYSMRVDGQWGDGSRRALARYHTAAKVEGGETEPTPAMWLALRQAPEATCKPEPVAAKPKAAAKKPAAPQKQTTQAKPAAKPAPAPAPAEKTGPKCKFLVVAIVCS